MPGPPTIVRYSGLVGERRVAPERWWAAFDRTTLTPRPSTGNNANVLDARWLEAGRRFRYARPRWEARYANLTEEA